LWDSLEDQTSDIVAGHTFALGGEIGEEAMPQDRRRNGGDIGTTHINLPVDDRMGLGGKDEVE
jgi:hypothetical protein